ncbi:hypothetical protein [Paenibacillus sp. IHBB 3054]|uniref:hypothetical protein n=1 Tax=Paenibacillus sp. IHBB 3054 TaxID=3425689 RepID=UPI003F665FFB
MKIDYEWLLNVSSAEVVTEVKSVIEGFEESSIADIQVTLDHTFDSSACRDQRIAVALIGNRGVIFEIRYWRNSSVEVKIYYLYADEVKFLSKH